LTKIMAELPRPPYTGRAVDGAMHEYLREEFLSSFVD